MEQKEEQIKEEQVELEEKKTMEKGEPAKEKEEIKTEEETEEEESEVIRIEEEEIEEEEGMKERKKEEEKPQQQQKTKGYRRDRIKFKNYEQKLRSMMVFRQQHFFHLHVIVFTLLGLISGLIIWAVEHTHVNAIDSIYTAYSALCITGLLTIDFSTLTIYTQIFVLILIMIGGLTVSTLPALVFKTIRAYQRMYLSRLWAKQKQIANQPLKNSVGVIARLKQLFGFQETPVTDLEYMSLVTLFLLIIITVVAMNLLIYLIFAIYLAIAYGVGASQMQGTNPWWSAFFITISSFNNAGITPFKTNMEAFAGDWMVSILIIILILIGNTLFPAIFRTIISILRLINRNRKNAHIFKYILDHHHNLSIHLFPLLETQIYVFVTIVVQMMSTFFTFGVEIYNESARMLDYHWATRLLIAAFHSVSTRTAGFNTVPISAFHVSTLLIYILLMRIKPQMFCNLDDKAYSILTVMEEISKMEDEQQKSKGKRKVDDTDLHTNTDFEMDHALEVKTRIRFNTTTFGSTDRLSSMIPSPQQITSPPPQQSTLCVDAPEGSLSRTSSFGHIQTKNGSNDIESAMSERHSVDIHETPEGHFRVKAYKSVRHASGSPGGVPVEPSVAAPTNNTSFLKRAWSRISTTKTPTYLYLSRLKDDDTPYVSRFRFFLKQFFVRLRTHTNHLLIKNNTWLLLIIFFICCFDSSKLRYDATNYTFLHVLFEVISAYGNVGLSMGYPGISLSFSAVMSTMSKILIIFTMILGRHRGLRGSMKDQNFRSPMSNLKRRFAKYYSKKKWWNFIAPTSMNAEDELDAQPPLPAELPTTYRRPVSHPGDPHDVPPSTWDKPRLTIDPPISSSQPIHSSTLISSSDSV